jgi:hypothetical protein
MYVVNHHYIHVITYILIQLDIMLENDVEKIIKDLFDLIVHIFQVNFHQDMVIEMERIIIQHDL